MKLVEDAKGPDHKKLLSYHLHSAAHGVRVGRSLQRIHASDVTKDDWCARRHALHLALDKPPANETLFTAQALAFEGSSAMARIVIRWATVAGVAVGDWECLDCHDVSEYQLRPAACSHCKNTQRFWYHEHRFMSEVSGVSGGIDLLVRLPGLARDRIVEIKALEKKAFQDLKMPLAEHRLRTNLYLRLAVESDDPHVSAVDTDTAIILYATKGGYGEKTLAPKQWGLEHDAGWTPFKEFLVERDDKATDAISAPAEALHTYRIEGGPMPEGICPGPYATHAQHCPVRDACFSGKHK